MAVSPTLNDALAEAARPDASEHEVLLVRRGTRTGAHTVVAVHSTVLGPALGGCRLWRYENLDDAVDDALRLSSAMTLKAAAARLPLGGGKAVIFPPLDLDLTGASRARLLEDFAETLNMLDGRYITAEDVGTTSADMDVLSRRSRFVVGSPTRTGGSGDPGAFTAQGVRAAMRACVRSRFGSAELSGRSCAIVGVGHVGEPLARMLHDDGAALVLSDVDRGKRELADQLGAVWLDPRTALRADVDVLAPCALGRVLDSELAGELDARIVCGSANNQLADPAVAEVLEARGVLYAPDFIVNAGGLINVSLELTTYDPDAAHARVERIEDQLTRILQHAQRAAITPLAAAEELAHAWLAEHTLA
jgi:leucine dehydrogenase